MNHTTLQPPDLTDWVVARASANLEAILGLEPGAAMGAMLDVLIDASDTRNDPH